MTDCLVMKPRCPEARPGAQVFGGELGLSLPNPALEAAELLQAPNARGASAQ